MNFKNFLQSKKIKVTLIGIVLLMALLLAFKAGEFVGYRKAGFSFRWAENYHRNFGGPKGGLFGDFRRAFGDRDYINAHGTFGIIINIDGNTLIVQGQDNTEKIILVSDATAISRGKEMIKPADLKVDDKIIIIGSPNDQGRIEARFIRVFPK